MDGLVIVEYVYRDEIGVFFLVFYGLLVVCKGL